jgi:aminoglycoside 6'-N-acetyltransferase
MSEATLPIVAFRPLVEADFPFLVRWLAEPHVRAFYQKDPVSLAQVALEYGPAVRLEEATICSLALHRGAPFAHLQCYRNADYPEWAEIIGVVDGISVDLFIGDPAYLRRGFGRAALRGYLDEVVFPSYAGERRAYIGHELTNHAALQCSQAVGFQPLRRFQEDDLAMQLLATER